MAYKCTNLNPYPVVVRGKTIQPNGYDVVDVIPTLTSEQKAKLVFTLVNDPSVDDASAALESSSGLSSSPTSNTAIAAAALAGGVSNGVAAHLLGRGPLRVAFAGDSFTDFCLLTSGARTDYDGRGFASHALALSRARMIVGAVLGLTGQTAEQIVTALDAWLLTHDDPVVMLFAGANNLGGSQTVASLYATLASGYAKILAAGRIPVGATILPRNDYNLTADKALRLGANDLLRAERAAGRLMLVDWDHIYESAAGTVPTSGGVSFDGVHPHNIGARYMGQLLLDTIEPLLPAVGPATWAPVGKAGQRVTNGVMNGTAGTVTGTGASGDVATGWYGQLLSVGTAVFSKVVSSDSDPTDWQQVVLTGGEAPTYAQFLQNWTSVATGTFQVMAEIEIDVPDAASLNAVGLNVTSYAGAAPARNHLGTINASVFFPAGNTRMVLLSPPITVGSTEASSMSIAIALAVGNGKTCTMRVRRVGDIPA